MMRVLSQLTNPKAWRVTRVLILDPHPSHGISTRPFVSSFYFLNNASLLSDAHGSPICFINRMQGPPLMPQMAGPRPTPNHGQQYVYGPFYNLTHPLVIATSIDIYVVLVGLSTQHFTNQNNLHNITFSWVKSLLKIVRMKYVLPLDLLHEKLFRC
jgi:hypothetical protein